MYKKVFLCLLLAVLVLFSSCQKEDELPPIDYSIDSSLSFELISQHENGWIKEGRNHSGIDQPSEEFEYYENGYIKSAKVYASYPQQHLYMEVSRSENNKPLWSKYYTPEGELWFETEYENGLPSVKKVYSEEGTSVHNFINGELTSVEYTAADDSSSSITSYDKAEGTRNVKISKNGNLILDETYPYQEQVGSGVYTSNHVPVANPFGDTETSFYTLNESFQQSPVWQFDTDPIDIMFPYRYYDTSYYPGDYFATRFAVSTYLYQSIIEQYPVTENGVLIAGAQYVKGFDRFEDSWEVRDSLEQVYNEDPELYKLKYGDQYVEMKGYGQSFIVIGAIRNLPSDNQVANEIKGLAKRKMMSLLYDHTGLTASEQEILDKVWFEVKFFSSLKEHLNGVVIDFREDYQQANQKVIDAELSVIQLKYKDVEKL